MVNALDVEPSKLLHKAAERLKEMKLEKPAFVGLVKTGPHAERPPEQDNFWFIRCASILRQAYVRTNVGVNRLRVHYGGLVNRGVRPSHNKKSGGGTIRKAMQTLEKAGLLLKQKQGRALTPKGRKFMDSVAKDAMS